MHKKYWFYILLISCLIFYFKIRNDMSIKADNFHIEDIASVDKIFLADRNGNSITLKKNTDHWIANNQYVVRKDAISTLLSTANNIRIKKPVSKSSFENVVKYIITSGVLVEFFVEDKIIKSYTIGSNTSDHLGNYMLLNGSKTPHVVHIPFFNGFLSPRYGIQGNTLNLNNWRSNLVFNLSFEDITKIKYTDYFNDSNSYFLTTKPLKLFNTRKKNVEIDNNKVFHLLNSFKNLHCEAFKERNDSINLIDPLEQLIVNDDTLRTYKISTLNINNDGEKFNVSRKYATINNGELMLIQDYVFNKVLINISDLIK